MRKMLCLAVCLLVAVPGWGQLTSVSGVPSVATGNVFLVGAGGVTANKLVKLDATGLAVVAAGTGDKTILGIAQTTISAGGYVTVLINSTIASCVFDNATTINHFVTISTTAAGDCSDTGVLASAGISALSAGTTVVGVVQAAVSLGATAPLQLYGAGSQAAASGSGGIPTSPTNALVKINGTNGAASSITDNGTIVTSAETGNFDAGLTAANGLSVSFGGSTNLGFWAKNVANGVSVAIEDPNTSVGAGEYILLENQDVSTGIQIAHRSAGGATGGTGMNSPNASSMMWLLGSDGYIGAESGGGHTYFQLSKGGTNAMVIGPNTGSLTNVYLPAATAGGVLGAAATTGEVTFATATQVNTLIKTLTGCNTATFVYTPQAADCVAPAAGSTGITGGTAGFLPLYSSATTINGNAHIDDGVTTVGVLTATEPIAITGTTPGALSFVAGTGSIAALPANSFGFAAPVTGGTSYLIKPPATITAGIAHYAAPATADGVNESALTSSPVDLASADVSGVLSVAHGGIGVVTVVAHTVFGNPSGSTAVPSFTSAPVLTSVTVGNNLFNTTGINTSGNDFTFNISSANLFLATTSNATNVQIQAGNTFTLGALSGCLSADATTHVVSGSGSVCGAGGGNTTSTSLTNNTVPRANGANSIIDSAFTDNGTTGGFARAGGFGPTHLFSGDINYCPDTSGSGTAQVCNTVGNFTPIQGSYIVYSTTTANTGTGLTINVNGLSAKSVSKWMGSTTTLAANDVLANKAVVLVYDGTTWELSDIGNAPSGGGGSALSAITAATGANTIASGNNAQVWNWAQTTTSQTAMTFGETTAATGTGDIEVAVKTITGSTAIPLSVISSLNSAQILPTVSITPTWNTSGVVDAALLVNVTNTASGAGSKLLDLQIGGVTKFNVDKAGVGGTTGSWYVNATTNAQAAGLYVGGQGVYAVGTSFFATLASASTSFEIATYNTAQTTGTGSGITFDAQNSSFAPIAVAGISGVLTATAGVNLTGDMVFCTSNNTACTEQMRLKAAGNLIVVGTVTSNLGTAAITSATPAAGVTSATCATAACTVSRGTYTVVGGTGTTGTFVTLLWPTTTTAWACSVVMNGGTGFLGLGHSVATATGMTVSAGVTILGTTFSFDYECQP